MSGAAMEVACAWRIVQVVARILALSCILLYPLAGPPAIAETRVALVIGNAAYHHAPALANPGHDARGVAAALRRLQFQVEEGIDLDTTGMQLALRKFADKLEDADVGLFFMPAMRCRYAGRITLRLPMPDWRRNRTCFLRGWISNWSYACSKNSPEPALYF
jgi:hypothetical protein